MRHWFDPAGPPEEGTRPDYRYSLANERTFLAWIRTGLALLGGGLAVAGFLPTLRVPHLREAIAVGLMLLGAAVTLRAVDHWARCERAMRLGQPLPASRFPAVLALIVSLGAVLLVVAAVLPGRS
ncbi:MAG: putative rane protein [Micromonosporaceae bacterium]